MKLNKTLTTLIAGAAFGLSGQVLAADTYVASTEAGTQINNTTTLGYTVNSVPQSLDSDLSFVVDNKVDLNVTAQDSTTVKITPNGPIANQYYVAEFIVRNDGNSAQGYKFTATDQNSGTANTGPNVTDSSDTATTSSFNVYVDDDTNGTVGSYDAASDTNDFIDTLNPGDTATVFVVINNSATVNALPDGTIAVVELTAITLEDQATSSSDADLANNHADQFDKDSIQVVFADNSNDGRESDTTAFEVQTATFTDPDDSSKPAALTVVAINDFICKGSPVASTDNTDYSFGSSNKCADIDSDPATDYIPKAIPGSQVKFTYRAKNTGSQATSNASFTKTLSSDYSTDSLANASAEIVNGGTVVRTIDSSDITISGNSLSIALGPIATNDEITITFTAIVK